MFVVPLIERKRDGGALTPEEWSALIAAYTAGRVADYQMSALLMAVVPRALKRTELAALTDAMLASGQRLTFDGWPTARVDKHSTGGGGDKGSLVLAPLLRPRGVAGPLMCGPGLRPTRGSPGKPQPLCSPPWIGPWAAPAATRSRPKRRSSRSAGRGPRT